MSMTATQYSQIKAHPSLDWLRDKAKRNQAVQQDTIKMKISEAIRSAFPDRVTDANIRWVADQVGTPWGNVHTITPAARGAVHRDAVAEVEGNNANMAQAVRMVFNRTAGGRSAPGTTNVNHIHVGGNAQENLLFDTLTATVLGVVDGHMDGQMSPTVRSQANRVTQRRGGPTVAMQVSGSQVSRA